MKWSWSVLLIIMLLIPTLTLLKLVLLNCGDYSVYPMTTQEERDMASVSQLVEVARAERELGNDFFYQNMFGKAMRKYEKVLVFVCWCVGVCVCVLVCVCVGVYVFWCVCVCVVPMLMDILYYIFCMYVCMLAFCTLISII